MHDIVDSLEQDQIDESMPDELRDMVESLRVERQERIEKLSEIVSKKRDESIAFRLQSGIETVWAEDEEYYLGLDDANRSSATWVKAAGLYGGLSRDRHTDQSRCSAFFNITGQFVDSAASRMGDILLPSGDWNFVIRPTPVADDQSMQVAPGQPVVPQGQPSPPLPPSQPNAFADVEAYGQVEEHQLLQIKQQVEGKVEKAEARIKDWLTECHYHTENRKVIEDSAKIGVGVLKGPVPKVFKSMCVKDTPEGKAVEFVEKISPATVRIDPWNFFPDPACGENIHDGSYVLERDNISAKQLRNMKKLPGYIAAQIDRVLEEGPGKKYAEDGGRSLSQQRLDDDDQYQIWYFYGDVDVEHLKAMSVKFDDSGSGKEVVPAIVTLVNDKAIKATLNPLDVGGFPYDVMPWRQVRGCWWGMGISRLGRVPQEMLNAAGRNLMDNAGLGGGPIVIARQNAIRPVDGDWTLRARKVFLATEQADVRSVADALTFVNVPMVQAELTGIIQLAYKMMEDSTSMAYLMQGQQGSAPDTVGGMELLNRNASANLRRLARTYDERVTEPHIERYYAWLLQYGEDDEKGDLVVDAVGSSALVEREIQAMEIQQLLQASLNPSFKLDPGKTMEELLKIKRMSPEKFQYDEEDLQKIQQNQAPAPAVQAAQIRAEAEKEIAQLKGQMEMHKAELKRQTDEMALQVKQSLDAAYNNSLANRDAIQAQAQREELAVKRELEILKYANQRNITLDQVKKDLAIQSQKINLQRELSQASLQLEAETKDKQFDHDMQKHISSQEHDMRKHVASQIMQPPVEPIGRAENGQAFER